MSRTPTRVLAGLLPAVLLVTGCKGWPYRAPGADAPRRAAAAGPVAPAPLPGHRGAVRVPRYVVVYETMSDLDVLRDWMGDPDDEVREWFKRWYLARHEGDEEAERMVELVEVLEGPRRRALASIFTEDPERFRAPKLGIPQPGDADF